jgi:phosphoserine phosphatase
LPPLPGPSNLDRFPGGYSISAANDEVGLGRSSRARRLRRVGTVVFDCDSTLSTIEGIDELAREHRAEVEALTDAAMRGEVRLEEVYGRRLAMIAPTRERIDELGRLYVERLVEDAAVTIGCLEAEGIRVRIMSGGLRPAVETVARTLGVQPHNVAAVDVSFNGDGRYAGYEQASPLTRTGGKRTLLEVWRRELKGPVMFVGDGITDLETQDIADLFVAYAGVIARPPVVAEADVVVNSRSLAPILPLALAGHPPVHAASMALYRKGLALLEPVYRTYFDNGALT